MFSAPVSLASFSLRIILDGAGAAPIGATKASHAAVRRKYKVLNLGVLYGQTPEGTARKLGISRQEAETLHRQHKATYALPECSANSEPNPG